MMRKRLTTGCGSSSGRGCIIEDDGGIPVHMPSRNMNIENGEQVFYHPLQQDEKYADIGVVHFKRKSFHEAGFVGGLFPRGMRDDPFERMAHHKQDIEDGAVRDEGVVQNGGGEVAFHQGVYGAGAAAARTVQSGEAVENTGGDRFRQVEVEAPGVVEENKRKKRNRQKKSQYVNSSAGRWFTERFHGEASLWKSVVRYQLYHE